MDRIVNVSTQKAVPQTPVSPCTGPVSSLMMKESVKPQYKHDTESMLITSQRNVVESCELSPANNSTSLAGINVSIDSDILSSSNTSPISTMSTQPYRKSYSSAIVTTATAPLSPVTVAAATTASNCGLHHSGGGANMNSTNTTTGSIQADMQTDLEDYARPYYEQQMFNHQKQSSYAQSEGYHSYVSSSDSTSATPFLDRLRQESEFLARSSSNWSQSSDLRTSSSISSSSSNILNGVEGTRVSCTEDSSSLETLKWVGSMSDVSIISHSTINSSVTSSQLIVHSAKVTTPKRQNSDSVYYVSEESLVSNKLNSPSDKSIKNGGDELNERSSRSNHRLFPVNTYTESAEQISPTDYRRSHSSNNSWQSVADRINELERQHSTNQQQLNTHQHGEQRYTYLDPSKTTRVSNPTLKAFQKNAVQSYFERQKQSGTSPQKDLTKQIPANQQQRPQSLSLPSTTNGITEMRQSLPNHTGKSSTIGMNRSPTSMKPIGNARLSLSNQAINRHSASYQSSSFVHVDKMTQNNYTQGEEHPETPPTPPPRNRSLMPVRRTSSTIEHLPARDYSYDVQTNAIRGVSNPPPTRSLSNENWAPERPPKNPHLRVPSPDLPPPPVSSMDDNNLLDAPLPPPPPEILQHGRRASDAQLRQNAVNRRNSFAGSPSKKTSGKPSGMVPPPTPKKPTPEMLKQKYLRSEIRAQSVQPERAQKVILHGGRPTIPEVNASTVASNILRMSMRKRAHSSQSGSEPIVNNIINNVIPPPLKPRVPIKMMERVDKEMCKSISPQRLRCSTKASYLPRHSTGKILNQDHGSYKLTLTSNEECINRPNDQEIGDIATSKCNSNLPDVLPSSAKVHHMNMNGSMIQRTTSGEFPTLTTGIPTGTKPTYRSYHSEYSVSSPTRAYPATVSESKKNNAVSPQYMSQSIIDLQKTHVLGNNTKVNQISPTDCNNINDSYVPNKSSDEFYPNSYHHRSQNSLDRTMDDNQSFVNDLIKSPQRNDGTAPLIRSDSRMSTRDSLKENIDKISQLQSQLMSAHLNENDVLIKNYSKEATILKCADLKPSIDIGKTEPFTIVTTPTNETEEKENLKDNKPEYDGKETPEKIGLIHCSEIVLRVNAVTTDSACQTDDIIGTITERTNATDDARSEERTPLMPRRKLQAEIDCDNLTKDLISHLSSTDRLYSLLAPKTSSSLSNYIGELYDPNISARPCKKDASTSTLDKFTMSNNRDNSYGDSHLFNHTDKKHTNTMTARFNFLSNDGGELTRKKEHLIQKLTRKLAILCEEQNVISEEIMANDLLGNDIANIVAQTIRPSDASKYRSYIDDVGYITMLLLSLSSRLVRVDNELHNIFDDHPDKKTLEAKKTKLLEQLDEAKKLHDDIRRRGQCLTNVLRDNLKSNTFSDYEYFVNTKAKLICDSREIADQIKLGEEQVIALKDTLVQSEC